MLPGDVSIGVLEWLDARDLILLHEADSVLFARKMAKRVVTYVATRELAIHETEWFMRRHILVQAYVPKNEWYQSPTIVTDFGVSQWYQNGRRVRINNAFGESECTPIATVVG